MRDKDDFTILTLRVEDNTLFWYTERGYPHLMDQREVRVDQFLPITGQSEQTLLMLYPNLDTERLKKCLTDWSTYTFPGGNWNDFFYWDALVQRWLFV